MAMNISRSRMRQPFTRSALEKNLSARASSIKPRVTFTWFNQPPAFAILLIMPGEKAKNVKGNASPSEKPNMPSAGPTRPPRLAATSNGPMMPEVQENDTITRVMAMKKMPLKELVPARESVLLVHDEGNVISKAPRKETPNTTKTAKKNKLAIQLEDSLYNAWGPK